MATTDEAVATGPCRAAVLTFAYDDPADPSLVTVYPVESDSRATTWLSIDADHAVTIADAR